MELSADVLSYHQNSTGEIPRSSLIHHRISYTGAAIFTIRLLQTILPPEKVCVCVRLYDLIMFHRHCNIKNKIQFSYSQASESLPDNTATAIFHICLDKSLGSLFPSVQEAAVAYLEQVDVDSHDLYRRVNRAALWMESTCSFLKEAQAEVGGRSHMSATFSMHTTVPDTNVHLRILTYQGRKELAGGTGVGRPSDRWPPIPWTCIRRQGVCSHLCLPVRHNSSFLVL